MRGLGITAGLEAGLVRDLAARCEQLGYHSLSSNDEPAASGLETLAHLAAATPRIELGVGVLPLDRYEPAEIAAGIDRLGIDPAAGPLLPSARRAGVRASVRQMLAMDEGRAHRAFPRWRSRSPGNAGASGVPTRAVPCRRPQRPRARA